MKPNYSEILTRERAEKFSAVEGLVLSPALRKLFDEFDAEGASGEQRRQRIREYFKVTDSSK